MGFGDLSLGGLNPGFIPLLFWQGVITPMRLYVLCICPPDNHCVSSSSFYFLSLTCFLPTGAASGSVPRATPATRIRHFSTTGSSDDVT